MSSAAFSPLRKTLLSAGACRVTLSVCGLLLAACSVYSDTLAGGSTTETPSGGSAGTGAGGAAAGTSGKGGTDSPATTGGTDQMEDGGEPGVEPSGGTESNGGSAGSAGTTTTGGGGGLGGSGGGTTAGTAGGGAAGMAGSGGMPAASLIDGFEDDDLTLEDTDGRSGVWYLFDDMSGGKTGPSPLACSELTGAPAELGSYAMHITATGFVTATNNWGSGLGVDFRAGTKPYDASKFTGLRFWAKVGAGKNTAHRLQLPDITTLEAGSVCNKAANAPNDEKCGNHFGTNLTFTTTWTQYVVPFDTLKQASGWGKTAPSITKASLYGIQITAKPPKDVDLWIDQIEFY